MSRHPSVLRSSAVLALIATCGGPLAASAAPQAGPEIKLATTGREACRKSANMARCTTYRG